jgi:hypothetical protein
MKHTQNEKIIKLDAQEIVPTGEKKSAVQSE